MRDATESDAFKDAWIKVIQAENHLARDSAAFIPRVQLEETNPTFKHPENWDSLSFQEKANLIIADKAVKLLEVSQDTRKTKILQIMDQAFRIRNLVF